MNRLYSLKRILTFIIAFAVTAGIAGSSYNSSLKITSADTESSQGEDYSYTESVADGGQQSDEQTENDDNSQEESTGFDITQIKGNVYRRVGQLHHNAFGIRQLL